MLNVGWIFVNKIRRFAEFPLGKKAEKQGAKAAGKSGAKISPICPGRIWLRLNEAPNSTRQPHVLVRRPADAAGNEHSAKDRDA
jgi:hypothetical protein